MAIHVNGTLGHKGIGNRGTGNREQGTGNRESGIGSRESGVGVGAQCLRPRESGVD
ncbi:hypothetical protein [Spirulina subsalsa]|uniref:hypothetical protein n=1 Tax=Spirulina subsalsa TaxID=54311 RepID=UPI0013DF1FBE|nr:hypothetical protein [Spirulina subsalsa]